MLQSEPAASGTARVLEWVTAAAGTLCVLAGVVLAAAPDDAADVGVLPAASVVSPVRAPADPVVPTAVELPDRHVTASVVPTGTDPSGALVVPELPTVGWWAPGASAGSASGTTVLTGHVDSAAEGLGAFAALRKVAVGERVVLSGADRRSVTYRVTARRQVAKAALPADLFATGGPPRLALVTCGGRFDAATRHYTDNVIVYAEPSERGVG